MHLNKKKTPKTFLFQLEFVDPSLIFLQLIQYISYDV